MTLGYPPTSLAPGINKMNHKRAQSHERGAHQLLNNQNMALRGGSVPFGDINGQAVLPNQNQVLNRTNNMQIFQEINAKKGIKTGMTFNTQNLIEQSNQIHGSGGSMQTSRKKRQILHDNLINSRGTNRLPNQYENDFTLMQNSQMSNTGTTALDMISPLRYYSSKNQSFPI